MHLARPRPAPTQRGSSRLRRQRVCGKLSERQRRLRGALRPRRRRGLPLFRGRRRRADWLGHVPPRAVSRCGPASRLGLIGNRRRRRRPARLGELGPRAQALRPRRLPLGESRRRQGPSRGFKEGRLRRPRLLLCGPNHDGGHGPGLGHNSRRRYRFGRGCDIAGGGWKARGDCQLQALKVQRWKYPTFRRRPQRRRRRRRRDDYG
mmetsp:Transcript_19665/g.66502  ORF Transcript_19665/g.66502 Transcript_19665/m.66502 type:complete len:206 (-) Transcript_19665:341-958(-)